MLEMWFIKYFERRSDLTPEIAALLNAALLYLGLKRESILQHSSGWLLLLLRVILACAAMYAVLHEILRPLEWWVAASLPVRSFHLTISVAFGAGAYVLTMFVLGTRLAHLRIRAD